MAKIRKAVFRSGIVMMSLLAAIVLSSSVAYAQDCRARVGDGNTVRAEGMAEMVGSIELRCTTQDSFFAAPDAVTLSIELNTQITNKTQDDAGNVVMGLTYTDGTGPLTAPELGAPENYAGTDREMLSEDGTTITWKLDTTGSGIDIGEIAQSVFIGSIVANAALVGDGGEITAVVRINGEAAHSGVLMLSDVMTGLIVKVAGSDVLQCEVGDSEGGTATITLQEGFASAFDSTDENLTSFVLAFSGIPDGVTATVPTAVAVATRLTENENDGEMMEPDPIAFGLTLTSGADMTDGEVELEDGSGKVIYTTEMGSTSDAAVGEWANVKVMFEWELGSVAEGDVAVSLNPVSSGDDDTDIPRYLAGGSHMLVTISPCVSNLLFPFVTNMYGFDTGIAITNTSEQGGSCMVSFSGSNAPADDHEVMVMGGMSETFGLGGEMGVANMLQGHITVDCEFNGAKGFAFITNGSGQMGPPTAAHGYLAEDVTPE